MSVCTHNTDVCVQCVCIYIYMSVCMSVCTHNTHMHSHTHTAEELQARVAESHTNVCSSKKKCVAHICNMHTSHMHTYARYTHTYICIYIHTHIITRIHTCIHTCTYAGLRSIRPASLRRFAYKCLSPRGQLLSTEGKLLCA